MQKSINKLMAYVKSLPRRNCIFKMPVTDDEKAAVRAYMKAHEFREANPAWGNFQIPIEYRMPYLTSEQQIYLRDNFGPINRLR